MPKLSWRNKAEEDLREENWTKEEALDKKKWGTRLHEIHADPSRFDKR